MSLTLDEAIARIPFLKDKKVEATPLKGGITNLNYKLESEGKAYVLRITGEQTEKLGISRKAEYLANLEAGKLGIAPEVVYYIEPEGYMVTRFIQGTKLPPEIITKPEYLVKVASKLKLFHEKGPKLPVKFNVFRRIEMLTQVSRQNGANFPKDFDKIRGKVKEAEEALIKDPFVPKPCHNDLLNGNWMEEAGDVKLLDWEYAGMGDIFFDLANFSHHHDLTDEQINVFLKAYFGKSTPKLFARLKIMWPMSEMHEAMWGTTQTKISKLDEDYQAYADKWFERVREHTGASDWDNWLIEVS